MTAYRAPALVPDREWWTAILAADEHWRRTRSPGFRAGDVAADMDRVSATGASSVLRQAERFGQLRAHHAYSRSGRSSVKWYRVTDRGRDYARSVGATEPEQTPAP